MKNVAPNNIINFNETNLSDDLGFSKVVVKEAQCPSNELNKICYFCNVQCRI